ncbi:hypothetical protein [Bifidobacterium rousetti]|uniref:hypothetical protein n=1 Tax=Bifidobacterium rousetti TaxID=2045439 RepID=UPI00123A566C|nr:hypothetical protein [Bifidobacterium rousetti]
MALTSCASNPLASGSGSGNGGGAGADGEPVFTGVHAEDYSWAYERAKREGSEFAVRALSDGELTEAETQEAADRYVSCMADKGFTATKSIDGSGDVYVPDGVSADRINSASDTCEQESGIRYLAGLLYQDRTNPDGKNDIPMVIDCMRRHGVVDDSMTDAQIEAELTAQSPDTYFTRIPHDMADPNYDANKAKWSIECQANPREF